MYILGQKNYLVDQGKKIVCLFDILLIQINECKLHNNKDSFIGINIRDGSHTFLHFCN